jgi:hypothetical protein
LLASKVPTGIGRGTGIMSTEYCTGWI